MSSTDSTLKQASALDGASMLFFGALLTLFARIALYFQLFPSGTLFPATSAPSREDAFCWFLLAIACFMRTFGKMSHPFTLAYDTVTAHTNVWSIITSVSYFDGAGGSVESIVTSAPQVYWSLYHLRRHGAKMSGRLYLVMSLALTAQCAMMAVVFYTFFFTKKTSSASGSSDDCSLDDSRAEKCYYFWQIQDYKLVTDISECSMSVALALAIAAASKTGASSFYGIPLKGWASQTP